MPPAPRLVPLALILGLFMAACTDNTAGVPVSVESGAITKAMADKAVAIFLDECKTLSVGAWRDVAMARASARVSAAADRQERYGWGSELEIVIDFSPTLTTPTANAAHAAQRTLTYILGGASKPGIVAKDRISQTLCGMKTTEKAQDSFKSVPALAVLGS